MLYFYPDRKSAVYYLTNGGDETGRPRPIEIDRKKAKDLVAGYGTLPDVLYGLDESEVHTRGE